MDDMMDEDESPRRDKETPVTEEGAPEASESETMNIPAPFLQGTEFKAGDRVVLKVVAVGDDGSIEVAYATEDEGGEDEEMMTAETEIDAINDGY